MRYKYLQQGGQMDSQQVLNQVVSIIETAGKEIQEGEVGKGTQALVQLLQDKQGAELVAQVVDQAPEFGQIVEAVAQAMQQPQSAEKGAILEAANGCKTCRNYKQLMRRGGKVVEMLVDCNGHPIIKAKKGCKVRKGRLGLSDGIVNEKYTGAYLSGAPAPAEGAESNIFYDPETKKLRQNVYADGKWGVQDFATTPMEVKTMATEGTDTSKPYIYFDPTTGQLKQQIYDANKGWQEATDYTGLPEDFYAQGYNPETGIFDSPESAIATLGQEKYDSYNTAAPTLFGVIGNPGNTAIGITGTNPTSTQTIQQLGGLRKALQWNRDAARATRRADRKKYLDAIRGTYDINYDPTSAGYTSEKQARDQIKEQYKIDKKQRRNDYTTRYTKLLNTSYMGRDYTPQVVKMNPAGTTVTNTSAVAAPAQTEEITGSKTFSDKQGGWLNKYGSPEAKCGKKLKKKECGGSLKNKK